MFTAIAVTAMAMVSLGIGVVAFLIRIGGLLLGKHRGRKGGTDGAGQDGSAHVLHADTVSAP